MYEGQAGRPGPQPEGDARMDQATFPRGFDLVAAKLTDVGRARPRNEDYVDFYVPSDPQQIACKGAMYLVADGMGGHQAGEVASRGAVELVISQYYNDPGPDVKDSLAQAFHLANKQIHAQSEADPAKSGMGTTLVVAVILGRKVYVANVGDSRAYLIGKRRISQITSDHSWVEEQVQAGLLTPEQARRHPQRNLVTRALGSRPSVDVDLFEGELTAGDTLLLCSDGLTGRVEDGEIAAIVEEHPPDEAARLLVSLANERGGSDNITVLIVSTEADGSALTVPAPRAPARKSLLLPVLIGTLALLVLILGGLIAIRLLFWGEPAAGPSPLPVIATEPATPAPLVSPTAEVLPSPTTTPSAIPTEATAEPTSTLAPTSTPTPQPEPTNTASAPPASDTPTPTPGVRYPIPVLSEPADGETLSGTVTFSWQWDHEPLPEGVAFDLRLWSHQEDPSEARRAADPTHRTTVEVDLQYAPVTQEFGPGVYYWTVVVVWDPCLPTEGSVCQLQVVSEGGERRMFIYATGANLQP
jgi:serine/threonine protein phosphatase PrpC